MSDARKELRASMRALALSLAHSVYLARDLKAAALNAGINETHPEIYERICELRQWFEDHFGLDGGIDDVDRWEADSTG
jgi:hypothetical protein